MSELVIRSGGLVEIDTGSLRHAATHLRGLATEADEIAALIRSALDPLLEAGPEGVGVYLGGSVLLRQTGDAADDARAIADSLAESADLYETVELLAERRLAEAAGDRAAMERADAALALHPDPWTRLKAVRLLLANPDRSELAEQALQGTTALGPVGGVFAGVVLPIVALAIDRLRAGRVPAGATLTGAAPAVVVRRLPAGGAAAPASLADVASRVPGGAAARIRVERYATATGPQFALYIAGTQSLGGTDAFDMTSNLQLYAGEKSASYEAVLAALKDAGARPGDVVHTAGHSQGAMVGERLALGGPYDARTVISFGSPIQAALGPDTLGVSVRHTDDPVPALQGGGHVGGVGAEGSFLVERVADPATGVRDAAVPAHHMSAYVETAEMVDAATDPRVEPLRAVFADLAEAGVPEVYEYSAERVGAYGVSPSSSGGGRR